LGVKSFSDDDFQAMLGVNKNGMTVSSPKDDAMRQAQQAQSTLMGNMSSIGKGTENVVATDSMRARGLNVGFDHVQAFNNPAVNKMKNGLARNTGKTKEQLFGGEQ
jgi:hypothetical protein